MPDRDKVLAVVCEWVIKAENDLKNAAHSLKLGEDCPTDTVCFHAQQCVEKYLKALLVWKQTPFAKTHDIGVIAALVPAELRPDLTPKEARRLTKYGTVTRYPGDDEPISLTERRAEREVVGTLVRVRSETGPNNSKEGKPMRLVKRGITLSVLALLAVLVASLAAHAQDKTLTIWTMGGDQPGWVKWLDAIAGNFEKNNSGAKVKITYYDKSALLVALKTALRAKQGPDVVYHEPDQMEFVDAGYLRPLDDIVPWDKVQPWAREAWTIKGHAYGIPYSWYTNEIFYNKKLMAELGVTLRATGQVSQADFLGILKKARAANMEPMVIGVGDRPFPGAYLTFEMLLRKLGPADYQKLLDGKLSYADARVISVLRYAKEIVDAGALPKAFATLKLSDSYQVFFQRRGLMFPQGTWYSQRAFAPADKGGQPEDFSLGVMNFPAMDAGACNNCRTAALSGGYGVSADTQQLGLATGFLKEMATPEMGELWTTLNNSPSGVLFDPAKVQNQYAWYFKELDRARQGSKYFIGIPLNFVTGQCRETFIQVINKAFPAGLVSVDETVRQMNEACYKG